MTKNSLDLTLTIVHLQRYGNFNFNGISKCFLGSSLFSAVFSRDSKRAI